MSSDPSSSSPPRVIQSFAAEFEGPLPPPGFFKEYESVLPGAADRIMRMAEQEVTHRHWEARDGSKRALLGVVAGVAVALAAFGLAAFAIAQGHPFVGGIVATLDVAGLVGTFIYGTHARSGRAE